MTLGQSLVQAIDTAYETQAPELRTHLGASVIGKECLREIWLGWRWAKAKTFSGRMLRLFERGQREESVFAMYLRRIGATVHTEDANGTQFRVSALGGHFGGSLDGAAVFVPGVPGWCLVEMKTHNDNQFKQLVKQGVELSHPSHYMQAQTYGYLGGIPQALYIGVNKNDDTLHAEVFPVLPYVGRRAMQKAETVIFAEHAPPRISEYPSSHKCRFCDFKDVCHGFEMPLVNCRTCVHAAALPGGGWQCRAGRSEIAYAARSGCPAHVFSPAFFPHATVLESGFALGFNYVSYMTRNRGQVTNGQGGTPSAALNLNLAE